jgi:hypothetical protein
MYVINDAHLHGVTSLALTSNSERVVSGGSEGEVRVFRLGILKLNNRKIILINGSKHERT